MFKLCANMVAQERRMLYAAMDRRFAAGGVDHTTTVHSNVRPTCGMFSLQRRVTDLPPKLLQKYYEAAGSHSKKSLGKRRPGVSITKNCLAVPVQVTGQ